MAGNPTLPKENIDEVILGLLALEPNEVDELSYEQYNSYLRELLVEITSGRKKIDSGETELIKNEFKRVRGKKGRFRIASKSSKVTANGLGIGGIRKQLKGAQSRLMLAPAGGNLKTKVDALNKPDSEFDVLSRISNTLDSIVKTLTDINKENKKKIDRERKDAENKKRLGKEKELESKIFDGIKKVVSTITKPFQSIWDRIVNFIKNIILGRILIKLIDWFADPQNQGKIKSLIRFFKDWWPAILGSYVLFGTTFGRFIRGAIGLVGRFIFQISRVAIPQLLKLINTPLGKAIALFTAGATIPAMFPGTVNEQERKTSQSPGSTQDKIKQLQQQKANLNVFEKLQGKGAEIDEQLEYLKTGKTKAYGFNGGGFNGLVSGPKGRDKVPAMLTDGEFVISAGAVNKYGVETFEAMNAAGGGTNKPQIVNGTTHAYGGGLVGADRFPHSNNNKSNDSALDLRRHLNNFLRSRGVGPDFDIGKPSTWGGGGTSASGGGGSGGFLSGLGYLGRVANQVPKMAAPSIGYAGRAFNEAKKRVAPSIGYAGRAFNEAKKRVAPSIGYAGRAFNEAKKRVAPILNRAGKVVEGVKQKAGSTIDSLKNFDFSGLKTLGSNIHGASTEALPALLASTLGISRTDKSISQDMQRALLQAQKNAAKRGQKNVDYPDYEGGGLSAGGLTMGKIENDEWKRDEKGRIIGLRQVYDTNRSARGAMQQAGESWEAFKKSGFKDISSLGRVAYKPFEAWLAKVQHRGLTMHDVNFDEKVLGFKPGKEVLNDTQRRMIKDQKNREALQAKRPWWDKMGMFGGASGAMMRDKQQFLKNNPGAKLYDKPQKNTGHPYKSRFSRPKNAGRTPVKPIPKPKPKVSTTPRAGNPRRSGSNPSNSQKPRSQNPTHSPNSTRTSRSTLGINKK
jgi:hypothetical protein